MLMMKKIMTDSIFEIKADESHVSDWVKYCTTNNDLFMTSYCGYWLGGLEFDNAIGWLCYVSMEIDGEPSVREVDKLPRYSDIVQAWENNKDLPNGFYRLDKAAAIRAFKAGIEHSGVNWYENADSREYDYVIQMALLGEIRYG
jgi:hypothetical protein